MEECDQTLQQII